jgi:superfamily I DNA/RNA helicase
MPLPTPQGEQSDALYLPTDKNVVVLGSAGSGKTTLALLRAAYLANPSTPNNGRTLLVTFNVALVTYLKHLSSDSADFANVDIRNYHHFARGILNNMGVSMSNTIVQGPTQCALVAEAVATISAKDDSAVFKRTPEFFEEEFKWIAQNGIRAEADYLSQKRTGRADSRLARQDRPKVFKAYEKYLASFAPAGYLYDWNTLATGVRDSLREKTDDFEPLYKHVVIDEGQDFSPEMLRSLSESLQPGGTVTFFADVAQQIYGHRMSWRDAGIATPVKKEFRNNYRNTREIAALALALSAMPTFGHKKDELVAPISPKAAGSPPSLVRMKHGESEIDWVIAQASKQQTRSVAILFRNRSHDDEIEAALPKAVRLHRDMKQWQIGEVVYFGTIHAAKGLEFDTVMIPYCGDDDVKGDPNYTTFETDEADSNVSKLLYVGITRARRLLILTYAAKLTRLLPNDASLYG